MTLWQLLLVATLWNTKYTVVDEGPAKNWSSFVQRHCNGAVK